MSLPDGVAGGAARRRRDGESLVRLGFAPRLRRRRRLRHGRGETPATASHVQAPQAQPPRRGGSGTTERSPRRKLPSRRGCGPASTPAAAAAAAATSASTARGGFLDARARSPPRSASSASASAVLARLAMARNASAGSSVSGARFMRAARACLGSRALIRLATCLSAGKSPTARSVSARSSSTSGFRGCTASPISSAWRARWHAGAAASAPACAQPPRPFRRSPPRRSTAATGRRARPRRRRGRRRPGAADAPRACFRVFGTRLSRRVRSRAPSAAAGAAKAPRASARPPGPPRAAEVLRQELDPGHRAERDRVPPPPAGGDGPVRRGLRHQGALDAAKLARGVLAAPSRMSTKPPRSRRQAGLSASLVTHGRRRGVGNPTPAVQCRPLHPDRRWRISAKETCAPRPRRGERSNAVTRSSNTL